MVRISDILRRGRGEEEESEKKSEEAAKLRKEKLFAKAPKKGDEKKVSFKAAQEEAKKEAPPELITKKAKEEKPAPSQVEIARVMMEKTKAGRPKAKELYQELITLMKDILAKGERYEPIEGKEIVVKIDRMIDQMAMAGDELLDLTNNFTPNNYLIGHLVNVCLISIKVGLGLGYNKSKLNELAISGFLYDIGMIKVMDIVQQPRKLTVEEYSKIKQHPIYGEEILKKVKDLTKVAIYVSREQHERMNGAGYPKGLKNDEISEYARIVGLIDVYEAMTHPRPHRKRFSPYEAMKEILKAKNQFDPRFLKVLISEISIYPVGSWVELSTHEIGKVIRINRDLPLRPTVNVIFGPDGRKLDEVKSIDLTRHPTLYIKKPLGDSELKTKLTANK